MTFNLITSYKFTAYTFVSVAYVYYRVGMVLKGWQQSHQDYPTHKQRRDDHKCPNSPYWPHGHPEAYSTAKSRGRDDVNQLRVLFLVIYPVGIVEVKSGKAAENDRNPKEYFRCKKPSRPDPRVVPKQFTGWVGQLRRRAAEHA